jgi:hypothetical protein
MENAEDSPAPEHVCDHARPPLGYSTQCRDTVEVQISDDPELPSAGGGQLEDVLDNPCPISVDNEMPVVAPSD